MPGSEDSFKNYMRHEDTIKARRKKEDCENWFENMRLGFLFLNIKLIKF